MIEDFVQAKKKLSIFIFYFFPLLTPNPARSTGWRIAAWIVRRKKNNNKKVWSMEIDLGEPAVGRDEKENVTLLNRQTTNNCNVLLRLIGKLTIRRRSLESAPGLARTRQHQQWKNSKTNRHKGGKLKSVGILHSQAAEPLVRLCRFLTRKLRDD